MATIERFEDIKAWQLSRELIKRVYYLTNSGEFSRDFGLQSQIRRAAVSILSNIAEGFERGGDKEFIQFLYIAKGSCGEVRAQLYVAYDIGYITETEWSELIQQCQQINRMIFGLIDYLQKSPFQGKKYRQTS